MTRRRTGWRRALGALLATLTLAGCTVTRNRGPVSAVSRQVEDTHRLEVDLTGPMPTREQLGLVTGQTVVSWQDSGSQPYDVVYTLTGGHRLEVPATSVVVGTTELYVLSPRSPDTSGKDALLPPNEVSATQSFDTRDQGRELLLAQADTLGLDRDDIDLWYSMAPTAAGPDVLLDKQYFTGTADLGYVDVSVGVFMADTAYVIWALSWDPPIPGYAYGTDGVPTPTAS